MIEVVGGIYRERCVHPSWNEYFGSGGRAASALATLGIRTRLHSYADAEASTVFGYRAALGEVELSLRTIPETPGFHYVHGLSVPVISESGVRQHALMVEADDVLRFGMLEGEGVVHARRAVYDPQDARRPGSFRANGSTADELALVLNRHEAALLLGRDEDDVEAMARTLADQEGAAIIVIKCGPMGAFVLDRGRVSTVHAYGTEHVWKIGSGDQFAAQFAAGWMHLGLTPQQAADRASRATAYYCEHRGSFPNAAQLAAFTPEPLNIGERWRQESRPKVYLAGPFFNLAQLWLVEQARTALTEMRVEVFSPYHDVGRGTADDVVAQDLRGIRDCAVVLALGDGLDAGTIFEIGYARALDKPVVMYSECESVEDRKMMEGSGCALSDDFVSAIYRTVWAAARE